MQVKVQKQYKSIDKLKERKRLMNKKKGLIKQVTRFKMHQYHIQPLVHSQIQYLPHFQLQNL